MGAVGWSSGGYPETGVSTVGASAPSITVTVGSDATVVLRPVMWMFIAVLVTFLGTRAITRRIRSKQRAAELAVASSDAGEQGSAGLLRNVSFGGVHVHHQVFGILIMCGAGIASFALTPQGTALNVCAAFFGVGISLAFDEFALWLHLDDVYWSAEGRRSVDAVFCLLIIIGILIGGADFVTGGVGTAEWWSSIAGLILTLAISAVSVLKGKTMTGIIGVFFQPVGLVGAIRLAKPTSWWARRRYRLGSKKQQKSIDRFDADYQRRWNRLRDLVAGAPDPSPTPTLDPTLDPTTGAPAGPRNN